MLGKSKLDRVAFLISKSLIDSYISLDKFVSVNIVSRENSGMKEETKNSI